MKAFDRFLQARRIGAIRPHLPPGCRILDIGCDDGALFTKLDPQIGRSIGCDPRLEAPKELGRHRLLPGSFPDALDAGETFQAITMLAVLEHIPKDEQSALAAACFDHLEPNGRLLITVPSPLVDHILPVLIRLNLVDATSFDEHYGFHPSETKDIFESAGFVLRIRKRFQLGLNNFFLFEKK